MKLLASTWLFFLLMAINLPAQTVSLTFRVDMSNENISPDGVHVAGDFQSEAGFGGDWNPGATQLTDGDGDKVYEVTVNVPEGTYLYKFVNGNEWSDKPETPTGDCAKSDGGGNFNREIVVGSGGLNLPAVLFDSCNAVIRFAVNMEQEILSANGLHVMGDFQTAAGYPTNWDPTTLELQDENGDGTYELSVSVPPGNYQYVFVNGNGASDRENLTSACAVDDGNGNFNRTISPQKGLNEPLIYCFGSCTLCDPSISTNYDTHWWNDAVFYEIFVRSFYDSDGDGIGDFQGIIQKLDYLNDGNPNTQSDLGIKGIWLMPMMESPSYHGYDVTNYYATEPDYGTMADFEELLDSCHARGIKVIIDFVMNHSSDQHPWFTQSASNQNNYRDWYVWSNTNPNFQGPWGQTVWHPRGGSYYYGLFWGGMPDLNYSHQPVKDEMFNITRFWMDKGVDGFRLDAIKYLDEDGTVLENTPETFALLEEFNQVYKSKKADAFTVGEVWSSTSSIIPYVQNNRLDVCFDFDLAYGIIGSVNGQNAGGIENQIKVIQQGYSKLQYATFLTNHDIDRIFSQFGNNESKMKLAASIYLSLPGIPFIYYGEELGMTGTGAHENIRRPMQWTNGQYAGFSSSTPWQGVASNYTSRNVQSLASDPSSLLNHYKEWVHLRNNFEPLRKGYLLQVEEQDDEYLSFARIYGDEAVVVVSNMSNGLKSTPELNLAISSLQAGTYRVVELLSGTNLDSLTIDAQGGIVNWIAENFGFAPRESKAYLITQGSVVSNQSLADEPRISLFPNPATDLVRINMPGQAKTIELLDLNGRLIKRKKSRKETYQMDISDVSAGIYFIKVLSEGRTFVKKLEISR